jgi:hypothetical protein
MRFSSLSGDNRHSTQVHMSDSFSFALPLSNSFFGLSFLTQMHWLGLSWILKRNPDCFFLWLSPLCYSVPGILTVFLFLYSQLCRFYSGKLPGSSRLLSHTTVLLGWLSRQKLLKLTSFFCSSLGLLPFIF